LICVLNAKLDERYEGNISMFSYQYSDPNFRSYAISKLVEG